MVVIGGLFTRRSISPPPLAKASESEGGVTGLLVTFAASI